MYDEPPDPEPNPCPFCEDELGYGKDCAHCSAVEQLSKAQGELSGLKVRLGNRARLLADQPIYAEGKPENGIEPRFLMAAGLLLKLGGVALPDDMMQVAAKSLLGEYGEWVDPAKDPERIERWAAMQWRARAENLAHALPTDVLDRRGASQKDALWILHLLDGRHVVASEAEKLTRNDWSSGSGGPWGSTLREFIDSALKALERSVGHWVEFAMDYARPPSDLTKHNAKISFVVSHEAYTAYVGYTRPSPHGGNGFGGAHSRVNSVE